MGNVTFIEMRPVVDCVRLKGASAKLSMGLVIITLLTVGCSDSNRSDSTGPGGLPGEGAELTDDRVLEPFFGVVFDRSAEGLATEAQIAQMQELGIGYAKFHAFWDQTEAELAGYNLSLNDFGVAGDDRPTDLTRELLAANPEWIEDYAFPERSDSRFSGLIDWSLMDGVVDQLLAAGIRPLPMITDSLFAPRITRPDGRYRILPEPLDFIQPGVVGIGREAYLAHAELHTAAVARRYSGQPRRVTWWNIENELNLAYLHVQLFGWRTGDAWLDDAFLVDLLATLYRGLKLGSPDARATHNVNPIGPNWADDLASYAEHLDAIGIGAYPNYVSPRPLQTEVLIAGVEAAAAFGKPVIVLETGNPSGPASGGWDEALQAEYLATAPVESFNAGAIGYIHFLLNDRDPKIWDSNEGELTQVENYWGLVRVDGTYKPSFEILQGILQDITGE